MMSGTDVEDEWEKLLSSFLKAVKTCQIRFGGRTELATEEDPCIGNLCQVLENILEHGLRVYVRNRGNRTIQHVKNLVSSSLNFPMPSGDTDRTVVWWFIRELLTQHEYHRFLLLKNVTTDVGRTRAWIRSLLNEHSLERYINIILSEEELLTVWFEPWALLRNQEKASMLPNLAAGLDTILFAINIDNEILNHGNRKVKAVCHKEVADHASKDPCIAALAASNSQESREFVNRTDYKKRKKKIVSQVVSFDDNFTTKSTVHTYHKANSACNLSDDVSTKITKGSATASVVRKAQNTPDVTKAGIDRERESSYDRVLESVYVSGSNDSLLDGDQNDNSNQAGESGAHKLGKNVESLKPVFGSDFSLIPLSPDGEVNNFYIPADSMSLKSYQDDNETAGDAPCKKIRADSKLASKGSNSSFSSFTLEELRAAVLEISRSRDCAEEKRNEVSELLYKQTECVTILKAQISRDQATNTVSIDHFSAKVKSLTRENELLRHQLKKYVSAVQMLRRDEASGGDSTEENALSKSGPDLRDYHDEALAYESKLIQVAEMHGELMEFNEKLQKLLRLRESQAHQLREELVELRGPFPQHPIDEVYEDAISVTSDLDAVPVIRTLINVWIPTAFLAGPPTDTHHVYQIYIRIKEDEWNIYRRFAQFYELHSTWKKKFAIVKTFDFPKKKTFGYKDIGVVDDRRMRLQEYLRRLINLLLAEYPLMATEPSKTSLTDKLPFLIDPPNATVVSPQHSRVQLFSRLSSGRNEQVPSSPLYNGL